MALKSRVVGFDGIGVSGYVTFTQGLTGFTKGTHEDYFCKVSANGAVSRCADNDHFTGVVKIIDPAGDVVSVQIDGYVTAPYTGTAPTVGYQGLVSDGTGVKIKADTAGFQNYQIVSVDTSAVTVTFLLGA